MTNTTDKELESLIAATEAVIDYLIDSDETFANYVATLDSLRSLRNKFEEQLLGGDDSRAR